MATFHLSVFAGSSGSGLITLSPENPYGYYSDGDLVTVTIVPDNGFTFVNWQANGAIQSTSTSFVFTMPASDTFLFATFTGVFSPGFSYATKYFASYCIKGGLKTTRIEIQPKDYEGTANEVKVQDVSFRFGNNNANIRETLIGSSLDFSFPVINIGDFNEFLTSDLRGFRVIYYRGYIDESTYDFKWTGYLTTDVFEEPDLSPPYFISLTATDGLKTLDDSLSNVSTFGLYAMQNIAGALRQTFENPLSIKESVRVFETRMNSNGSLFNQFSVNSNLFFDKMQPLFYDGAGVQWSDTISIKKALIKILSPWVCRLFQWNENWMILRLNELTKGLIIWNGFDEMGTYTSVQSVDNDTQVLDCLLFDRPIRHGSLGFTEFNASLILGDVSIPQMNEILVEPFEGVSWLNISPNKWVLRRWQYFRCTPFDGVRNSEICRIEYVTSPTSGATGKFARFWGTANGIGDLNMSYIESNQLSRVISAGVAIENANTISIGAKYQILRRASTDAIIPSQFSHVVGIAVQIGNKYLYETGTPNVFDWTTTPTIITIPVVNSGTFNNLEITNVVVPQDGEVQFRLYQLITVMGIRHRYFIDWDDAFIQLEKNDALVNEAILGKALTDVKYPNIASDYETYIGDALTNLSSSAIKLNTVANTPVSENWSRDNVESLQLLEIVLQDLANLEGKNNYRVRGTYYGDIDPTKAVIYKGRKYLVNSFVLDDWQNKYDLDLFELTEESI